MDTQQRNKELAQRWFSEGWGGGKVEIAEQIFAPDFRLGGRVVGPDGPRRSVLARHAAFADLSITIEHILADDDHVVTHFSTRARHAGPFHGIEPTGEWIDARGIVIWRVADGKVVEDWNCFDLHAVLSQIRGVQQQQAERGKTA